jgi:tetratricopeptide (TPR) repeat protein
MPRTDELGYGLTWFWQEYYEGKYQEALERLEALPGGGLSGHTERSLMAAYVHLAMENRHLARDAFESARVFYEEEIRKRPDDYRMHSCLGIALAGLGRKEEAIRHGRRAVEIYPVSLDAFWGPEQIQSLAVIYMFVDEEEKALDQIEYLQTIPSWSTMKNYRLSPFWKTLWDHPRFIELERKYENPLVF